LPSRIPHPATAAKRLAQTTHIKMLEPPFELPDIHERMYWHTTDSGHRWLRERLKTVAAALDKAG
jgi:hypothetical protein